MKKIERIILKYIGVYAVPLTIIVLVVLLSLFYVIPTTKNTVNRFGQLKIQREELASLKKKRALLESFTKDSTVYLTFAESALPQEKNADTILVSLDNVTTAVGVGTDAISFTPGVVSTASAQAAPVKSLSQNSEPEKHKGAYVLRVKFVARGSTEQFVTLVNDLLGSRRVFDIEAITISYQNGIQDFLVADLSLLAYYLPPIDQIGSIESALPELTEQENLVLSRLTRMPYLSAYTETTSGETSAIPLGKANPFMP